jgi:hypothetical protein
MSLNIAIVLYGLIRRFLKTKYQSLQPRGDATVSLAHAIVLN